MVIVCEHDFLEYVIPHLQRSRHFPVDMQRHDIRKFYRFLYKIHAKRPMIENTEQRLRDAYGDENRDWRAIDRLAAQGIECLSWLMDAKVNDYREVYASGHQHACDACRRDICDRNFRTDELLLAYYEKRYVAGMLPHPRCRCEWCRCYVLPDSLTSTRPLPPGVDPAFSAWVDEEVRKMRDRCRKTSRKS